MVDIENISLSLADDLTETEKQNYNKLVVTNDLTSSTLPAELPQSNLDVEVKATTLSNKPKASRRISLSETAK